MSRVFIVAILMLAATAARAGVTIEMVERNAQTGKVTPGQKIFVQNGATRSEDPDGDIRIFRGDSIIQFKRGAKTYRILDKQAMTDLGAKMAAMRQQMQARMAKMPPEQRAQMEKAMGSMAGMGGATTMPKIAAVDTGKNDNVDGRSCRVWVVTRDGKPDDELCVVPYASLPGSGEVQAVFKNMAKFFEGMTHAMGPQGAGRGVADDFRARASVNGFPIRSRGYANGKLQPEMDLVKTWKEEALPATLFEPPAGAKKEAVKMGGADVDDGGDD